MREGKVNAHTQVACKQGSTENGYKAHLSKREWKRPGSSTAVKAEGRRRVHLEGLREGPCAFSFDAVLFQVKRLERCVRLRKGVQERRRLEAGYRGGDGRFA